MKNSQRLFPVYRHLVFGTEAEFLGAAVLHPAGDALALYRLVADRSRVVATLEAHWAEHWLLVGEAE